MPRRLVDGAAGLLAVAVCWEAARRAVLTVVHSAARAARAAAESGRTQGG